MLRVALAVLLFSSMAAADYCKQSADLNYFKAQSYFPQNHLAVINQGGLFNGGVCWWHSLFQRAALYLTVFKPDDAKPSPGKIKEIVHAIAVGKQVVEISGYRNIFEFSQENWPVIQQQLEDWQLVDGFLKQAWINSVTSTYEEKPEELKKTMETLFNDVVVNRQITWVMLKFKGFGAHAWLVVDMTAVKNGYEFVVIDSNYPSKMVNVAYETGTTSIESSLGLVALFPGRHTFFKDLKKARTDYCSGHQVKLEQSPLDNNFE